jgi:hypothetical protein
MESVALVASVRGDAEGLIRKVAILEGEPVEAHWAWEEVEESAHSLSSSSAEGARWLVAFETTPRVVRGAFPSVDLGERVVPHH